MYNITVPSRYVGLLNVCNCKTFRRVKGKGFMVYIFTYTTLLVGLYILWAAYMARGFTEPSCYFAFANGYNCGIYRRG